MKVLIVLHHRFDLWRAPAWLAQRLRQDFPDIEFVSLSDYKEIDQHMRDADVAVTWSLRPEQLRAAQKLKWVHSPAAAVHQLMFPELVASDVVLTNARAVHGPVVAEHALALVLALAKKLPQAARLQASHVWGQQQLWEEPPRPRELLGATLGLLGLGSIGGEVAKRGAALGMQVIAVREHPQKGSEGVQAVYGPLELDQMLARADYVVLAAPLTSKTGALFDGDRLARMKREACLINVSRGALVDETALAQALRQRTIAGAALDVFANEPLPPDSPLWDLENVLITPHTAAVTERLWERHYQLMRENLRRFRSHEPLLGMVDKQKGY